VSSGTRTVRVDAGAASVQKIVLRQESDAGVNNLVFDTDFGVNMTSSIQGDYLPFEIETSSTNAVRVDLNGHKLTSDGGEFYSNARLQLDGTWVLGAGSVIDFVQHGNHAAHDFVNDGRLEQTGSQILYRFSVKEHNTTQRPGETRRWVNNGVWTMNGAGFLFDARKTDGTTVATPGQACRI